MSFDYLGLRAELLKAVKAKGYKTPTPIQNKTIPSILKGRDILARAQTGTGKTDAFALPMVEILSRKKRCGRHPRALVLTPTRELAHQVGESIKVYARKLSMRCTVVYGGVRVNPQIDRIRRGIDILVATPGRLLDLARQKSLNLSQIEFMVFDEADRMLDLGFSEEISEILDLIPTQRQTMLFSATYTPQIRELAGILLQKPESIEVTPKATAAKAVTQKIHLVEQANKRALLIHLITRGDWHRVLVFTRTKHGANKLTEKLLEQGINATAMHSDKSQLSRTRTLEEFKNGEIRILVATDVAARGLDIESLPYVVNFDMPTIPEDYIHRIGRTGRAGASGIAVSLVSDAEKPHLQAIEKLLKQKISVEKVNGYSKDSDLPDYILYRPDNTTSEKNVDPDLKALLAKRAAAKQRSQAGGTKTTTSRKSSKSKLKSKSRSSSRPLQSPNQRKTRGRR